MCDPWAPSGAAVVGVTETAQHEAQHETLSWWTEHNTTIHKIACVVLGSVVNINSIKLSSVIKD